MWDERWGLVRFDGDPVASRGVFTAGAFAQQRSRWSINAAGWNSAIEYRESRDRGKTRVAVVGDSFVLALQVDGDRSLAGVLRHRLGARAEVYSFGIAGAPLSAYLQMSRYVTAAYDPDVLVVVVVHNDFDESLAEAGGLPHFLRLRVEGGDVVEVPASPYRTSPWRRALNKSALFRYVSYNLNVKSMLYRLARAGERARYAANVETVGATSRRDAIAVATAYSVGRIVSENPNRTVLFAIDAPRSDLYAGRLAESRVRWMSDLLRQTCDAAGCGFLDLSEAFERHFLLHRQRFETRWDSHWNELGHQVAAEAVYEWLVDHRCTGGREPIGSGDSRQ